MSVQDSTTSASTVSGHAKTGNQKHPHSVRGHDLYETPAEVTRALLHCEALPLRIWEPACGPGAMASVLREAGHHVVATDLVDYNSPHQDDARRDFLFERALPDGVQAIVTNPPYKIASEFIAHALSFGVPTFMFLRTLFVHGGAKEDRAGVCRRRCLTAGDLARLHLFTPRPKGLHRDGFDGKKNSNAMDYAWFVWLPGTHQSPQIDWVDPRKYRAGASEFHVKHGGASS